MRWFEYKMEVDSLHASEDLKARLLAMQADAAAPEVQPAPASKPAKRRAVSFPLKRVLGFAACFAVGVVCCGIVSSGMAAGGILRMDSASTGAMAMGGKGAETAMYAMASGPSAENGAYPESQADSDLTVTRNAAESAKIIYTASLDLESKNYDEACAALERALETAGGYMETCDEYSYTDTNRSLELKLRVPEENYQSFLEAAAETGNLVNKSERAEDITTQYMDVAARIANLEAQRARLQELEAQAESLSDLLEVESSLSDVQYQLESWQNQMNWYNNQVEYCTVNVSLYEVREYTPVKESFGQRIVSALGNGWDSFVAGVQQIVVWFAYAWPVLILLCIGTVAALLWNRRRAGRRKDR